MTDIYLDEVYLVQVYEVHELLHTAVLRCRHVGFGPDATRCPQFRLRDRQ